MDVVHILTVRAAIGVEIKRSHRKTGSRIVIIIEARQLGVHSVLRNKSRTEGSEGCRSHLTCQHLRPDIDRTRIGGLLLVVVAAGHDSVALAADTAKEAHITIGPHAGIAVCQSTTRVVPTHNIARILAGSVEITRRIAVTDGGTAEVSPTNTAAVVASRFHSTPVEAVVNNGGTDHVTYNTAHIAPTINIAVGNTQITYNAIAQLFEETHLLGFLLTIDTTDSMVVTIKDTFEGLDWSPTVPTCVFFTFTGSHKTSVNHNVCRQFEIGLLVSIQLTACKNCDAASSAVCCHKGGSIEVEVRIGIHTIMEVQQFLSAFNQERMCFRTVLNGLCFGKGEARDRHHNHHHCSFQDVKRALFSHIYLLFWSGYKSRRPDSLLGENPAFNYTKHKMSSFENFLCFNFLGV